MEYESAHPIAKEDLLKHIEKTNERMSYIDRGGPKESLYKLLEGVGSGDKHLMDHDVQNTLEVVRDGFCLYYHMYSLLEDRIANEDVDIGENEKREFIGSYSMFVAGSYTSHKLDVFLEEEPLTFPKKEDYFKFDYDRHGTLGYVLSRYYGLINSAKRTDKLKEGADLAKSSIEFFEFLRDEALAKKRGLSHELVDLVKDSEFRIADEFTIHGYDVSYEDERKLEAKAEFVSVKPHEVVGNVLAKKEILRDMDRITLFDLEEKRNPVIEVGGLSWSVLYDGFPGTGKSSLFKMGLTRLQERSEQIKDFWKFRNFPGGMKWKQLVIDQGIKDEYYGKTGKNLLAILEEPKKSSGLFIITTDDIDLLVSGDRNDSSGGSDRDILNILMQYADGINTVIKGNVQWWAATNDATAMDPALRQRFISRYHVSGPEEWYDFADIFSVKLGKWIDQGIITIDDGKGYKPFEMRREETGHENSNQVVMARLSSAMSGGITLRDIGELCKEMKDKNQRFTGRAVHAISEAVAKRINDYEIPEDWFTEPKRFLELPYDERSNLLRELCNPISGDIIVEETERYFKSEQRYSNEKLESDVEKTMHNIKVRKEALKRLNGDEK